MADEAPKVISVGRLGEGTQNLVVQPNWTVAMVKEKLEFDDDDGQAYGVKGGQRTPIGDNDIVNGYDAIIFANKVKGGQE